MKYVANIPTKTEGTLHAEVTREEAFKLLHPLITVDCFNDDGSHYGSFGCINETQINPGKQIEDKSVTGITVKNEDLH